MSILWMRQRRCVDKDVDEDLDDDVSAMASQRRVDDIVSLEGVPCGDKVSMPCRAGDVDEDCIPFHTGLACGQCMLRSLLVGVLDEVCGLVVRLVVQVDEVA